MKVLVTLEIEVHNEPNEGKAVEAASDIVTNLMWFAKNEGCVFNDNIGIDDIFLESAYKKS